MNNLLADRNPASKSTHMKNCLYFPTRVCERRISAADGSRSCSFSIKNGEDVRRDHFSDLRLCFLQLLQGGWGFLQGARRRQQEEDMTNLRRTPTLHITRQRSSLLGNKERYFHIIKNASAFRINIDADRLVLVHQRREWGDRRRSERKNTGNI
jgi:hypothetical protein